MRHNARVKHFGRKSGPRKALWRGLVNSLVEHGRIKTTLAKAKELRRHVEKAITVGKKQSLHARRLLLSRYPNEKVVSMIMADLAPRFQDREGGYTRILKLGQRPGDRAEMAYIQFVDFKATEKAEAATKSKAKASTKATAADKAASKEEAKATAAVKRVATKKTAAKKKRVRKLQTKARAVQRANRK
jgi:large subunit ribosomal protein L17